MTEPRSKRNTTMWQRLLAFSLLFPCLSTADAQEREFNPVKVGRLFGRFQPITEFPIVPANKAELEPNELVLGVVVNGKARAYPINMLTGPSREILNDQLGGAAIAATW
ncbi:MAG TPA: DUF3179 domain-containing protein [Planctomycetes bacterium]|nr:DUF3179 domain-containing protein [Planctomycetaceae bacterium]HIM31244.1 DUF3179 domain-containing protein [Planctomycetota bacterium]